MNRALPGTMIDLIRDGVPPQDLRDKGDTAVWKGLVRTAMSACNRGQDRLDWMAVVGQRDSKLGEQAKVKKGKRRTQADFEKHLREAWERATEIVASGPSPWTRDEAHAEVARRAFGLIHLAEDPEVDMLAGDRAVLAYAARLAVQRGTDKVALPWREVMVGADVGEKQAKNALKRLHEAELLVLVERGRASGPSANKQPKANLYRLGDDAAVAMRLYRGTRSVGPRAQACGTSDPSALGTSPQDCGTPEKPPNGTPDQADGTPALGPLVLEILRAVVGDDLTAEQYRTGVDAARKATKRLAPGVESPAGAAVAADGAPQAGEQTDPVQFASADEAAPPSFGDDQGSCVDGAPARTSHMSLHAITRAREPHDPRKRQAHRPPPTAAARP